MSKDKQNIEDVCKDALVVDDIKTNRFILVKLLNKFGINTVEVEDGQQAVNACKEKVYSIIFMDIDMPVMDGIQATQGIRKLSNGSENSPIIAITAGGVRATEDICLSAGMNDHYIKPIDKKIVEKIIDTWYPHKLNR